MLDMQTVLGMSTNRNIVVRDLYYQGTNVDDGLLCHIFKAILWLGIEESWYKTISRICRVYAVTTTLKPKAKRISKEIFEQFLFDPCCETKDQLEKFLKLVKLEFENKVGSDGFKYPKARDYNLDKLWSCFEKFKKDLLERMTNPDEGKAYLLLSRPEIKKLCEKYFKNIGD